MLRGELASVQCSSVEQQLQGAADMAVLAALTPCWNNTCCMQAPLHVSAGPADKHAATR